jgi:hypothetical protein
VLCSPRALGIDEGWVVTLAGTLKGPRPSPDHASPRSSGHPAGCGCAEAEDERGLYRFKLAEKPRKAGRDLGRRRILVNSTCAAGGLFEVLDGVGHTSPRGPNA